MRAQIQQTQALINSTDAVNDSVNSQGQAITDAINNQSANEKSEYQSQAQQNEQNIDSDVANNETQAVSLISVITTVFNTIKDASAYNCVFHFPSNLVGSSSTAVNLCPNGYTRFLNSGWAAFGTSTTFTVKNVFGGIIMVVVLVNICIAIISLCVSYIIYF